MSDFLGIHHGRRVLLGLLTAASVAAGPAPAATDALSEAAGSYRIEPTSSIRFTVDQVGGGGIHGSFGSYSGSFTIDGNNVAKSSVAFTLLPESVSTGEKRIEAFLRSDAVFDVEEFPKITFRSTKMTRTGDNQARIDGVLTARGKSLKAQFAATVDSRKGKAISFHVTGSIYRAPYNMDVGVPIYSNVVQFDMKLSGTRK